MNWGYAWFWADPEAYTEGVCTRAALRPSASKDDAEDQAARQERELPLLVDANMDVFVGTPSVPPLKYVANLRRDEPIDVYAKLVALEWPSAAPPDGDLARRYGDTESRKLHMRRACGANGSLPGVQNARSRGLPRIRASFAGKRTSGRPRVGLIHRADSRSRENEAPTLGGAMAATQRRVSPGHDAELEAPSLSSEPHIRYARAADGASIAYWTMGRGAPLVYLAGGPWSHVELWQIPECRSWYERLAYDRRLVRFDMRGTGLSTRDVADYSLQALLLDMDAVVERLDIPRFALFGAADAGPLAIAYAARHPERVSHLVLWCAWARGADVNASPRIRAWRSLLDRDWELMTETCAYLALGWSAGEIGRQAAERLRATMTREGLRAALDAAVEVDTRPMLAAITAPSLVLHRREISWLPVSIARELASRLPEARLVVLDGESTAPYLGDSAEIAQAIGTFLNEPGHRQGAIGDAPAAVDARPAVSGAAPRGRALTDREIQVVRLVASGLTNEDIAGQLVLSVRTVERHISNIYDKLGTRSRARTIAYALTNGLV